MNTKAPEGNPLDLLDDAESALACAWVALLIAGEDPTGFGEEAKKLAGEVRTLRAKVVRRMPELENL